jgi:mono/diheme cytochrome c family protein
VLHGINVASAATTTTTAPAGGGSSASVAAGLTVYTANCSGCHGATGMGQPGVFPPLANNPVVNGPYAKVIPIVEHGLTTPITVNGVKFQGTMPPWKGNLTNQQIANVLTYIRSSWGNSAGAVTLSEVAATK